MAHRCRTGSIHQPVSRTLVIGDIHGGLRALLQVLEEAKVHSNDKLIFLGDYVDGWSESPQVIEYVMALAKKQTCIFIKGNHDECCEDWLRTGHADKSWLFHGGQATAKSYEPIGNTVRQKHLRFFESLKLYYIDPYNRLFIHAGFTSNEGPQAELASPGFGWDRTLWETALSLDRSIQPSSTLYPRRLKLFSEIYIGHTPTLFYDETVPMNRANIWNVDTGAAFTGKLTVMDVDTKKFWQSDSVRELYPGEPGRNRN